MAFRPVDTTVEQYASLDVTTNDPVQSVFSAVLAGRRRGRVRGRQRAEPQRHHPPRGLHRPDPEPPGHDAASRERGRDHLAVLGRRRTRRSPSCCNPLAHYSTRATTCSVADRLGHCRPSEDRQRTCYCFAGGADPYGGQNQMLDPAVTGATSFSPGTAAFGLSAQGARLSDDAYNTRPAPATTGGSSRPRTRAGRSSRTRGSRPSTSAPLAQGKNFDYQDEVIIMTNADPQIPLSPAAPVPGASSLSLNFSNTYPGTVADAQRQRHRLRHRSCRTPPATSTTRR